jgi:hypothetical protein
MYRLHVKGKKHTRGKNVIFFGLHCGKNEAVVLLRRPGIHIRRRLFAA